MLLCVAVIVCTITYISRYRMCMQYATPTVFGGREHTLLAIGRIQRILNHIQHVIPGAVYSGLIISTKYYNPVIRGHLF